VIRAVLDTNVWVAGLLNRVGAPARICDLALGGAPVLVVSPAIAWEYEKVLARPELALPAAEVRSAVAYFKLPGPHVVHVDPTTLPGACTDPNDDHFLAAALAGRATAIVTGNLRYFPPSSWKGIRIVAPAAFLRWLPSSEQ